MDNQTLFQSYDILAVGELQFPRGNNLQTLSWEGTFYNSEARRGATFIKYVIDPAECVKKLDKWRKDGNRIKVLITETNINDRYDIESFSYNPTIHGEYSYSISLVQGKDVEIEVFQVDKPVRPAEREPVSTEKQKAKTKPKKNDNKYRQEKRKESVTTTTNTPILKDAIENTQDYYKTSADISVKPGTIKANSARERVHSRSKPSTTATRPATTRGGSR